MSTVRDKDTSSTWSLSKAPGWRVVAMCTCVLYWSVMSDSLRPHVLYCSLPGSSVHRTFQARILEQVAISSFRGSSQPRDRTQVSCISCVGRRILYHWATWEAPKGVYKVVIIIMYLGTGTKKGRPNSEKVPGPLSQWCQWGWKHVTVELPEV